MVFAVVGRFLCLVWEVLCYNEGYVCGVLWVGIVEGGVFYVFRFIFWGSVGVRRSF